MAWYRSDLGSAVAGTKEFLSGIGLRRLAERTRRIRPSHLSPSAVLGSLSGDDLQAAYDHVLEQFALERLIGAHENSEWSDGKLVIDANHGPIHLTQAAFYAVRLEVQRRDTVVCCR